MMTRQEYTATGDVLYSGTAKNGLRIRVLPKKGFSGFYAVFATDYGGTYRRFAVNGTDFVKRHDIRAVDPHEAVGLVGHLFYKIRINIVAAVGVYYQLAVG